MRFDVLTVIPDAITPYLSASILGRAADARVIDPVGRRRHVGDGGHDVAAVRVPVVGVRVAGAVRRPGFVSREVYLWLGIFLNHVKLH